MDTWRRLHTTLGRTTVGNYGYQSPLPSGGFPTWSSIRLTRIENVFILERLHHPEAGAAGRRTQRIRRAISNPIYIES